MFAGWGCGVLTGGSRWDIVGRQIEATDGQIDRLVYELYGLSEGEIRVVEGK